MIRTDMRFPTWQKLAGIAALALAGGVTGFVAATLSDGLVTRWEDDLAVVMAAAMIAVAIISIGVMITRPRTVPKGCGVLQIVVMLLAGAMFLLPVFGTAWLQVATVFGLIVALLAVQSVANVMLWRRADEMLRRVMWETCAMAFWALQVALFLYAAAERLGLVAGITAWGMMGILMAVYFIASMVASARRGIT